MVAKQRMMQTITQAATEAAKTAIMVVKKADTPVNSAKSVQGMPRAGGPVLKQPIFDWKTAHKYQEL